MGVNQNTHPCITQGNTHLLDGVKKNTPHCNTQANKHLLDEDRPEHTPLHHSLCLNYLHLLARRPKFRKKFYLFEHNFHLSESSFTCPWLRASGLVRRLALPWVIPIYLMG